VLGVRCLPPDLLFTTNSGPDPHHTTPKAICKEARLGEAMTKRIDAATGAAARLTAAAGGSDRAELSAAIRSFDDMCKPGGWGWNLDSEPAAVS